MRLFINASFSVLVLLGACGEAASPTDPVETVTVGAEGASLASPLKIVETLAADDMGGRQTGTEGNLKAREYLEEQLAARGLGVSRQSFVFEARGGESLEGINLLTRIEGKTDGPVMVVTAHYDHVGTRDGEIFNGADDNASGVAGALAVADHFLDEPPEHDVLIALLDAEEMGLQGARALVRDGLPDGDGEIAFNLNFDMLSKNDKNELYAAGTFHSPFLVPMLDEVVAQAPVSLKLGHDDPALGADDWTLQSDHGPFHSAGIPFIYFGVEDHPDYHQPSDVFATVPQDFFLRSVETVVMAAEAFDANLMSISNQSVEE